MLSADFAREDGVHTASLRAALTGQTYKVGAEEGLRTLRAGEVRGTLYGGCLSIITALLGTPFEPQTEGKLLFLEDTGEKPFQVDRMLWQLRQAGKLEGVRGIVFGEMVDCAAENKPGLLEEAILSALEDFEGPIAIGLRSGHVSRANVTLTLGVEAELKAAETTELEMLEAAVEKQVDSGQ
jgi:muramoyltetrapeptide carboxypeptidase